MKSFIPAFFLFFYINLIVSGQNIKDLSIFPCDGIRSTSLTGLVEVTGGYIAMGSIDTFYNGNYGMGRIWVVKLDLSGKPIWQKFYQDSDPNIVMWGRKLAKADNDGVYVLAQKASETGVLFKLDKDGEVLWKKNTIVMPNSVDANHIISTQDEGCLLVGNVVSSDSGAYQKFNKDGTVGFSGKFKPASVGKVNFYSADIAADGGYYLVGIQNEYNPYPVWRSHLLTAKISYNGQMLWSKAFDGGDETSGDKRRSEGYTISSIPDGGFVVGGLIYKGSILNGHAYLIRCQDDGEPLWSELLFENLFPSGTVRNAIPKLIVKDKQVIAEFVQDIWTTYEKNFIASVSIGNGSVSWKQTGYKISDQHNRSFHKILKNGQLCFIGGENYLNYPRKGLVLLTTSDGLWSPPSIKQLESGVADPEIILSIAPHILFPRTIQISSNPDFNTLDFEKTGINSDTTMLNLSPLKYGHYYFRAGINGPDGNILWSDTLDYIKYDTAKLRYADKVISFSSQYGGNWSANQVLGAPNVYPKYGDLPGAWASQSQDNQREFLELQFNNPEKINGIVIFQNYNPGAIDSVLIKNPNNGKWELVFYKKAEIQGEYAIALSISFPTTSFPVSEVRLAINSPAVPGFNEIDAIGLLDATGVSTDDQFLDFQFSITPNPVAINLLMKWDEPLNAISECSIIDATGKLYYKKVLYPGTTYNLVPVENYPPGLYFASLNVKGIRIVRKFLKQ